MNVEIGTEAGQFLLWERINGIFVPTAVFLPKRDSCNQCPLNSIPLYPKRYSQAQIINPYLYNGILFYLYFQYNIHYELLVYLPKAFRDFDQYIVS
jgi:hypothetical protein